ncbi:TrkH-domain-containing protein [Sanghuangporus baumii]|uniref:TrkH-domain-containing protein n=1 Tax=Sanghuangporus baumii TaxID=108892 RepID=A0A9Q5HSN4_SANBA|nr:TrkH-domain-containing protein [Sanghuangporus baumii]
MDSTSPGLRERIGKLWSDFVEHLNFFRVHVLFLYVSSFALHVLSLDAHARLTFAFTLLLSSTFTPLIFSGIFYAANGSTTHVSYIDALFICFSAGTGCGLAPVDLSGLTGFQQAILFVQSTIGNPVAVSWVMVYIRKRYFNKRLQHIVETEIAKRKARAAQRAPLLRRLTNVFTIHPSLHARNASIHTQVDGVNMNEKPGRRGTGTVRPDAIRRTSATPRRVDPNGAVILDTVPEDEPLSSDCAFPSQASTLRNDGPVNQTGEVGGVPLAPVQTTHTVTFQDQVQDRAQAQNDLGRDDGVSVSHASGRDGRISEEGYFGARVESPVVASSYRPSDDIVHDDRSTYFSTSHFPSSWLISFCCLSWSAYIPPGGAPMRRRTTVWTHRSQTLRGTHDPLNNGPIHNPLPPPRPATKNQGYGGFPYPTTILYKLFRRKAVPGLRRTLTRISTLHSHQQPRDEDEKMRNKMKNSVKYFSESFSALIGRNSKFYDLTEENLEELGGVEYRALNALLWIIAIRVPGGFGVYDVRDVVGRSEHGALPGSLPPGIRVHVLDLGGLFGVFVVILLNCIDWFLFLVLNIGVDTFEEIPLGVRFAIGVLQSTCARAAGFATMSISAMAPALHVQATNVYEEKSLGVFEDEEEEDDEAEPNVEGTKPASVGRYLAWHARRQLSFDMWWLGLVLVLLCIIERGKIRDSNNFEWFTIFALSAYRFSYRLLLLHFGVYNPLTSRNPVFEIISAYSGVGMSMGVPYANFSFSGAFTPLSKLVMVIVMLRGRHRGLPVAIDRAVMLPFEFKKTQADATGQGRDGMGSDADDDEISVINRIIDDDGEVRKKSPWRSTFTPLIFSGIFYAANGSTTHVSYIDALFICFSAGTGCGLAPVDLSGLTGFQQAILFVQSTIGNPVAVSWVMVYIRKRYFNKRLQHIVETEIAKRKARAAQRAPLLRRLTNVFTIHPSLHARNASIHTQVDGVNMNEKPGRRGTGTVRPDAIRRTSATPRRVDPNGAVILDTVPEDEPLGSDCAFPSQASTLRNDGPVNQTGEVGGVPLAPVQTTHTVTFQDQVQDRAQAQNDLGRDDGVSVSHASGRDGRISEEGYFGARVESPVVASSYRPSDDIVHDDRSTYFSTSHFPSSWLISFCCLSWSAYIPPGGAPMRRRTTMWTHRSQTLRGTHDPLNNGPIHNPLPPPRPATKNQGYGGFPYPTTILYKLFRRKAVPGLRRTLTRISTLHSHQQPRDEDEKMRNKMKNSVKYFSESFSALIGRNSKFYDLTEENLEELGGVEYRALNALLWIIAIRFPGGFGVYDVGDVVSGPEHGALPGSLPPGIRVHVLDLGGLFGVSVVILLNCIDWFLFLVLNIGVDTFEEIPLGVRFAIGVLQSTCARAAGFATMSISAMAPALHVQATNVYEEKSLGVFEDEEEEDDEAEPNVEGTKPASVGRYLAWHARRQLSFDMWWLGLVLVLLCIIERGKIRDSNNFEWFTIFALSAYRFSYRLLLLHFGVYNPLTSRNPVFEIISAYSGVGMSMGVPYANFSFSGAFTPLSKLVMVIVMLRGRHRGLPVAIDRAVMLPFEFKKTQADATGQGRDGMGSDADDDEISVINRIIDDDGEVRKKSPWRRFVLGS